jgi:hypothetical protein
MIPAVDESPKRKERLKLDWSGALEDMKDQYTSVGATAQDPGVERKLR